MEKILPGKYVAIAYDLYIVAPDGQEAPVLNIEASDPEHFIFGITPGMIKPLERALEGLETGSEFNVFVAAGEGFPYNPDDVANLDRSIFLDKEGKLDTSAIKVGAEVPMLTADGYTITGRVLEITDTHVRMDFNHPLVGKDLRFKGKVVEVRDATADELHPAGCGGCCGGGCAPDGNCGDGCDCGCN